MPIAIVVENGTIVDAANSYVTITDMRAYAASRGITLPISDDGVATLLILATDYLEALPQKFIGEKVSVDQVLKWPRQQDHWSVYPLWIDGVQLLPTEVPKQLIVAQMMIAAQVSRGVDLQPVQTGPFITSEQVDVIRTTYSDRQGPLLAPIMPAVDNVLAPLLRSGGNYRSIRV